ncbi:hypothetical protein J2I47_13020 [Fibrella sp. HMF5335]|uniref:DUF5666 domain-containing protein n=1 Tax=Fibrella rubiginis TaxID=2817060 RepID=A0A939GFN7_9BACT|nr:hypothetical protein [Fibrella rubiginis]MBO0937471.1 hypothetical protein [Fibrella rubiginis]
MKKRGSLLLLAAGVCLCTFALAQQPFANCAAAFVGNKMVVDSYTPKGQCRLSGGATGLLTVQTVELSPTQAKAVDKVDFKVAIRDKDTGTLHLFSGQTYKEIPVQDVLTTCKKGDRIVLLTVDNQYALPHNEIVVQ